MGLWILYTEMSINQKGLQTKKIYHGEIEISIYPPNGVLY